MGDNWLHSDYSHDLFERAGVSCDDFIGLRGIAKSEVSDRIVVWTQEGFGESAVRRNPPENLHRMVQTSEGFTEYYFNPVK